MASSETWLAGARPYLLLGALCLCLYLPGLAAIPVTDRDEARFAQATRQMLESGDFLAHPLPGRGAQQQAGRDLLAAGRRGRRVEHAAIDRDLALSRAVAAGREPRGAVHLRLWPALLPRPSRAARLIGAVLLAPRSAPSPRRISPRPTRRCSPRSSPARARSGSPMCAAAPARVRPGARAPRSGWREIAAILLKGPVGPGARARHRRDACRSPTATRAGCAGCGRCSGIAGRRSLVAPWLFAIEHATAGPVPRRVARPRFPGEDSGRAGIAWRAAVLLSGAGVADVLAGLALSGAGVIGGWRRRERAGGVSCGLAGAGLGRARTGADQAAALRAAALSGAGAARRRCARSRCGAAALGALGGIGGAALWALVTLAHRGCADRAADAFRRRRDRRRGRRRGADHAGMARCFSIGRRGRHPAAGGDGAGAGRAGGAVWCPASTGCG